MPLEITYFSYGANNPNMPGLPISSEVRTISGTSAQSGATPAGAVSIRLKATENARYAYGANPTATAAAGANGHYLASGDDVWVPAVEGWKFAAITPS